jgi:hypothetical protein
MAGSVRGSPGLMMLSLALAGRCWRTRYARARSDQSRTSRDLHDRHSTVSWPLYLAEHRSTNVFLEVIVGAGIDRNADGLAVDSVRGAVVAPDADHHLLHGPERPSHLAAYGTSFLRVLEPLLACEATIDVLA